MRKNKESHGCKVKVSECQSVRVSQIFLVMFLCVGVLIACGCVKKEIKNVNSQGSGIICFGDSITLGYGVEKGEDYPSLLGKKVDMPVINAGIDGDTTVDGMLRIKAEVLDKNPMLVLIEFGGNDFLRKVPKETTLENLRKMIDMCHEKGAMVALVDISAGMFFKEYRGEYAKICRQKNVIFVPSILNGIITNPMLKSDFFHPNVKGYQVVCERIYKKIEPYLRENKETRL